MIYEEFELKNQTVWELKIEMKELWLISRIAELWASALLTYFTWYLTCG